MENDNASANHLKNDNQVKKTPAAANNSNSRKITPEYKLQVTKNRKNLQLVTKDETVTIPLTEISKVLESVIMPINDTLPPVVKENGMLKTGEYMFHSTVTEKEVTEDIIHYLAVLKHLHDAKKTG